MGKNTAEMKRRRFRFWLSLAHLDNRHMRRWLQLAVVGLAMMCAFVPADPVTVERSFSTWLYPSMQRHVTSLSNLAPFALFDVFTLAAVVALVTTMVKGIVRARRERRWSPVGALLARIGVGVAFVYLLFLVLWGFNYRRVPMTDRLVLVREAPGSDAVLALGVDAARNLNALHASAHATGWPGDAWGSESLRTAFASVQSWLSDAPAAVPGRVKRTIYGAYFRWTSVDGMVNPFALEVLANPDLLPFERPFVASHEWAHLAGYADEAAANFVGWLTCLRGDVGAQYSGWLYLYWQVAGELDIASRKQLAGELADGPRRDVQAIAERLRRGQLPMLRNASWLVYDQYLRANRVEEGIRSYGEVVTLILRARFDDGWVPVRRAWTSPSR